MGRWSHDYVKRHCSSLFTMKKRLCFEAFSGLEQCFRRLKGTLLCLTVNTVHTLLCETEYVSLHCAGFGLPTGIRCDCKRYNLWLVRLYANKVKVL